MGTLLLLYRLLEASRGRHRDAQCHPAGTHKAHIEAVRGIQIYGPMTIMLSVPVPGPQVVEWVRVLLGVEEPVAEAYCRPLMELGADNGDSLLM